LELQDSDNLPNYDNVTTDTMREWICKALQIYSDSLETTWPDLTPLKKAGGKIIQFHGESDNR
jgi:tannase